MLALLAGVGFRPIADIRLGSRRLTQWHLAGLPSIALSGMEERAMDTSSGLARGVAALIALVCWFGLAVQFNAIMDQGQSAAGTLWIMLRYFTILTNLIVAVMFTGLALGRLAFANPSLLGGTTMAIVLVGVVNHLLLRGLLELSGGAKLADTILHYVTPIAVLVFWLVLAKKGQLTRRDPPRWALYPLAYLIYALVRGSADGKFAYPFLDYTKGVGQTAVTVVLILLAFVAGGFALVWADGALARPSKEALTR